MLYEYIEYSEKLNMKTIKIIQKQIDLKMK